MGVMSVVSIPLKTEKWQSDLLEKRLELCRQVYNAMLGYELKKLREMERRPEYKQAQETIAKCYKEISNDKERKKNADFKAACNMKNELMKEYRFSKFGFTNDVSMFYLYFNENVYAEIAGRSIAEPMWSAFEKYFFGNGERINFKRKGEFYSMVTSGRSGIRIVDEKNKTVRGQRNGRQLYCLCGTNRGKVARMQLKIDKKDTYKLEMLDKTYKCVRLTYKEVKGVKKWYVQITVDGAPAIRYDTDGNIRNPINDGTVYVYVDTSYVIYTNDRENFKAVSLKDTEEDKRFDNRIAELQKYLDNSRRATNPENFNEDGTIKKGVVVDGERHKLKWTFSNSYKKASAELRNLHRVQAENRKEERIMIANEILTIGNEIVVNDFPFQYAAMRKKEKELTGDKPNEKKKKLGYAIGHNAPALLVTLIDQKLISAGYDGVTKIKLSELNGDDEVLKELKGKSIEIRNLDYKQKILDKKLSKADKQKAKVDEYEDFLAFVKSEIPDAYALLRQEYMKAKAL